MVTRFTHDHQSTNALNDGGLHHIYLNSNHPTFIRCAGSHRYTYTSHQRMTKHNIILSMKIILNRSIIKYNFKQTNKTT